MGELFLACLYTAASTLHARMYACRAALHAAHCMGIVFFQRLSRANAHAVRHLWHVGEASLLAVCDRLGAAAIVLAT